MIEKKETLHGLMTVEHKNGQYYVKFIKNGYIVAIAHDGIRSIPERKAIMSLSNTNSNSTI